LLFSGAAMAEKVVVDLDIGDDIDDAFALAFTLASPELEVLGIGTTAGDTALRVRLVRRFLHEAGRDAIPVAQGIATKPGTPFTQAHWAARWPADGKPVPSAIDLILDAAARYPGEVTLLALGPLTNVAAALERDPQRFRKLKRIVLMGGSIRRGYGKSLYGPPSLPAHEYNIASDPTAARTVFAAGVPIEMFPLDATLVRLDDVRRNELFAHGTPLTDALTLLYHQWSNAEAPWVGAIPTLFDVVPIASLIDHTLCPSVPLRVVIGDDGSTVEAPGPSNARVCLGSDSSRVLDLMMKRLLAF
jgi:inosine-uridine nucleoside N-ribohydrolase